MYVSFTSGQPTPHEGYIPVEQAKIFYREIGQGQPIIVIVEIATHIAQAIPGARLVVLRDCGHFTYLECPEQVRKALIDFFDGD